MKRSGGGKRRLPAAGAITASVVLLAASAAAAGGPVGSVKAPDQDRPAARDQVVPRGAGDTLLPSRYEAAGPVIPAVYTGDIPATVLDAYRHARDLTDQAQPGCHLPLELLEAIGKVETRHARNGLVDANGTTLGPILGPVLDGNGFAAIPDTDGGRFDGDPVWDRAVGPMQFIPGTWAAWSADGNGDHRADPNNVYDASLAAARYLCAANRDLGTPEGLSEAIFSYNHSTSYRNLVLSWMATYANGTTVVPDATTLDGGAPVQIPAAARPARAATSPGNAPAAAPAARPAPAPAEPPISTQPAPPATTEPVRPIIAPATAQPAPTPTTTPPAGPAPGLVCGVTGLVGGLLGSLTGGGQPSSCAGPTAKSRVDDDSSG